MFERHWATSPLAAAATAAGRCEFDLFATSSGALAFSLGCSLSLSLSSRLVVNLWGMIKLRFGNQLISITIIIINLELF